MTNATVQKTVFPIARRAPGRRAAQPARRTIEMRTTAEVLSLRLEEKRLNYERAAMRLQLRGETDAADVLRRAADRIHRLTASRSSPRF
ncbi:MAG: hypothetical protein ACX939_01300 [Hyphococcus sp.]